MTGPIDLLDRVLAPTAPPFALVHRPEVTGRERLEVLVGEVSSVDRLADLPFPELPASPVETSRHDVLAIIPYRQIRERGFECQDDGTPLQAMRVTRQATVPITDVTSRIPEQPVLLRNTGFDIDDVGYAAIVRKIVAEEIGTGEGANFVIKRSYLADVDGLPLLSALTFFRHLLDREVGAYWTFLVNTPDRILVGATPERHVSLRDRRVVMNPISGTYRYPLTGPTVPDVLRFLEDKKEADELYMVVDEELKMMARVCQLGVRVTGPYLKEMAKLAHSEYLIHGRSTVDVRQLLRETMFAPTVTGSPLENACRVINRYEPVGRGYYSGVLALVGADSNGGRTLDSSILIRTADIARDGKLRIDVGATLVRHSDPDSEVAETRAKATALLAAALPRTSEPATSSRWVPARNHSLGAHQAVRTALERKNTTLARFWLAPDVSQVTIPSLVGRRVMIIDAEDTFTAMLEHQARALGPEVTVRRFDEPIDWNDLDLVIVGPGPGDPRADSPKNITVRDVTRRLLRRRMPFLSVCLAHQILCRVLGLELVCRDEPNQGVQWEIDLFGRPTRAGFYNTFVARSDHDTINPAGVPGTVHISRDPTSGEVHALRGGFFGSIQFHAESVLTQDGPAILGEMLGGLAMPDRLAS